MRLKHPQTVIFWSEAPDGIRRAVSIRPNVKSPEQTKVYKALKLKFDQGQTNAIGWKVYRPGPMEAQTIKPGTAINAII